jgi:hypothetical protein
VTQSESTRKGRSTADVVSKLLESSKDLACVEAVCVCVSACLRVREKNAGKNTEKEEVPAIQCAVSDMCLCVHVRKKNTEKEDTPAPLSALPVTCCLPMCVSVSVRWPPLVLFTRLSC